MENVKFVVQKLRPRITTTWSFYIINT